MSGLLNVRAVVIALLNRTISPYVDNLNPDDLNVAVMAGDLTLHNLHLKRSAVDKYNLPVEVVEGNIGHLHVTIPWLSFRTQPITIQISDVFLLVKMKQETEVKDNAAVLADDERRAQEAKQEKLRNAESIDMAAAAGNGAGKGASEEEKQSWLGAFTSKLIDNVQISIKNIHCRYEDNLSTPDHPFAAGFTLSEFKAVSTDENWVEAFITDSLAGVRKLARLDGLSLYFDTDAQSIYRGSETTQRQEMMEDFRSMISTRDVTAPHQYILKPVSGESRVIMRKKHSKELAKTEAQVFFDEIGFVLDDDQYRDALSMLDLFHFYTRTHQYRRFRPADQAFIESPAKARWKFATNAIVSEIHDRNKRWSWSYLAERRDNRKLYADIYAKTLHGNKPLSPEDQAILQKLELELSYEDIRFFRSVARSQARKDAEVRRLLEEEKKHQQVKQGGSGWLGWVWGSSASNETAADGEPHITEADRQQLNEIIDYDASAALVHTELPRDFLLTKVTANLRKGSLSLRSGPHGRNAEIISLVFDSFGADVTQLTDSLDAFISLGDFRVYDGTMPNTLHSQIVRVKDSAVDREKSQLEMQELGRSRPFFTVRLEHNPLDRRADNGITVKMRHLEIIYHRGYVDAVFKFFKPPSSQLESIGALLDAAGQTLDELRRETRAGLEYALEQHRTVDMRVDMNAPIIIVPEDPTTKDCLHLVLDAGHIAISSALADKEAMQRIQAKRGQQYSEDDFQELEQLMYDRFSLRLESTQLLIGNDLDSCLAALEKESPSGAELHLVERINMGFSVQNAILNVPNLTRFKVSGHLPQLQLNFSDTKYKSLMRIIDIAIPSSGEDAQESAERPTLPSSRSLAFRSRPTLEEYTLQDEEESPDIEEEDEEDNKDTEEFYEVHDTTTEKQRLDLRQKTFDFSFAVGQLTTSLFKSNSQGMEVAFADAVLDNFGLNFALRKFDMSVDVFLRSVSLSMVQQGKDSIQILFSDDKSSVDDKDILELLRMKYQRVQKASPEFMSVYEGVDQSINVQLSTFNLAVSPKPILEIYDFIMTTFVPEHKDVQSANSAVGTVAPVAGAEAAPMNSDKLRIRVKLTAIRLLLKDDAVHFATLALTSADVALLMRGGTMRLSASLGNLSLHDETLEAADGAVRRDLLRIEGEDLADFSYETFDSSDKETFPGYNSSVILKAGSLRFTFLEDPIQRVLAFGAEFAQLKAVYDAASQAAIDRAPEVTHMKYDVAVKTPIVVLPRDGMQSEETIVMRLGEIRAHNEFNKRIQGDTSITASLKGVNVASDDSREPSRALQLVDNVNIDLNIWQAGEEIASQDHEVTTETEISGRTNDIKLALTEYQYSMLMDLVRVIPRAFDNGPSELDVEGQEMTMATPAGQLHQDAQSRNKSSTLVERQSIETKEKPVKARTKLEFSFCVPSINLELFDAKAVSRATLHGNSIAKFRMSTAAVTYTNRLDGSVHSEVSLKAITMSNTRAGSSIFREIIPAADYDGYQFMLQYDVTGANDPSAVAVVTVDSPQIIFAVDPMFALLNFALSPFKDGNNDSDTSAGVSVAPNTVVEPQSKPATASTAVSFRFAVVQSTIMVLASDSDPSSQAIQLGIKQVELAHQNKTTLVIKGLGMSFGRMDAPSEQVRFLDDLDITLALDAADQGSQKHTNIILTVQPIIFRASLTDIMLITDVVNKAIALAAASSGERSSGKKRDSLAAGSPRPDMVTAASAKSISRSRRSSRLSTSRPANSKPQVLISRESLRATIEGFQLVLIGAANELPVLHLSTEKFSLAANDWSSDLKAATSITTAINYYNLTNSHWEPLMDPWNFSVKLSNKSNGVDSSTMAISLSSQRRLEFNLTSVFIEMAITSATLWNRQSETARKDSRELGAPFMVRNQTGYSILVWSDSDRKASSKPASVKRLADGHSMPWRFEDHKRLRENIMSSSHNAFGLQIEDMPWERLRNLSVDREGDFAYPLRPRKDRIGHRLVCDVKVKDNVKIVTFRSSMKIENMTHLPMELALLDKDNKATGRVYKIPPGEDCPLPIEAAFHNRFKLRPDRGFDYSWSDTSYGWEDLVRKPVMTIECKHRDAGEASFMFRAAALFDRNDPACRLYPRLTLRLRAPLEIENLLPYNIRYRVYDKKLGKSTTNFCIRGGSSPVHTVRLSHLLLLSVEAQDSGFKQSEFAIINTDNPDDFRTEDTLVMVDKRDIKLPLKLHYSKYPGSGGAFKVQVYSPYVIINKTGLPFNIASKSWPSSHRPAAGYDMFLDDHKRPEPTPFMFAFPREEKKDRMLLKVADAEWSTPFSVAGVGADSEVVLHTPDEKFSYHVGLSYVEGLGKYKLSKVITLTPRYIIANDSKYTLNFRQYRRDAQSSGPLGPGKRYHMSKLSLMSPEQVTMCISHSTLVLWSAPINLAEVGRVHVRVHDPTSESRKEKLFRVDTQIEGSTIFLFVNEETGRWPLQIRNETALAFQFQQTEDEDSQGIAQDRTFKKIRPHETVDYAWDSPAATGKRLRLVADDQERIIDIMEIGVQPPFKFRSAQGRQGARRSATVSLDVRAEGNSQVLIITPYDEEESVYKPRRPGGIARSDSMDSLNVMSFETVTVNEKPTLNFSLNFEGIGISIINRHLQELVYMSFRGLKIAYTDYPQYYEASLDCKWIQIDNQRFGNTYPMVLYPTVVPKDGKELESHPTLQLSAAVLKDEEHGVMFIKYATILLQSMAVEIDQDIVYAFLDFAKFEGASWQESQQDILIEHPVAIPEPERTSAGPNLYFEDLALQPISLELSFQAQEGFNADKKVGTSRNPFFFFLNAIIMTLGNVDRAPVQLNALLVHNARVSMDSLTQRVILHYSEQLKAQLYSVIGSADFLGNPVGLFNNVSSGVQDIFYEPYQGLVMHGNKELGIGIARGATSFAKKTIFGVTDSMSKFTGSIGKGLSSVTLDSEYQTRRRMAQRRNKPRHALYGVTVGANAFATSVASGFEGLALKPLEGAESGGVGGFFRGVGKGFVGVVTKPVVGVLDFASNVTEGIRNTTTVFDQATIDKVRLPRFIAADGILRPFSERDALGQSWLKDLGTFSSRTENAPRQWLNRLQRHEMAETSLTTNTENGKYFNETYVAHLDVPGDDTVVMLTTTRILLIRSTKLRVIWEVLFDDITTISLEPSGIQIVLSGDVGGPFLPLPEQNKRMYLFKKIEGVVRKHNEAKKVAELGRDTGK